MNAHLGHALVVGGSSGLGLEIARLLAVTHRVVITCRRTTAKSSLELEALAREGFGIRFFDAGRAKKDSRAVERIVAGTNFDVIVYAAGYYHEARIDELQPDQIRDILDTGVTAPACMLSTTLREHGAVKGFIAITSTSEWTPREYEPVYTAAKAGLKMLAQSVSLDRRVGKVLVAAPSGMKTPLWDHTDQDTSAMLDPKEVAAAIMQEFIVRDFEYAHMKILRAPFRVEVDDVRT